MQKTAHADVPFVNRKPRAQRVFSAPGIRSTAPIAEPVPEFDMSEEPLEVAGWNILIAPLGAKTQSDGGIAFAETTQQAEEIQIKIGKVIGVGPTCMEGKTTSGIELKYLTKSINTPEQLLGKFLMYQAYTGHAVRAKTATGGMGKRLLFITATEVLAVVKNPEQWRHYI